MSLDSSKIYNSSILQTNLLYKHVLLNLLALSKEFENCSTNVLCPQMRFEIITLPKSQCLQIIKKPQPFLNGETCWKNYQGQAVHPVVQGYVNYIDNELNKMLSELAKTIVKETKETILSERFVKIVFPVEGMFSSHIDNNLIYLNCRILVLVTPEYFYLPQDEDANINS